MQSNECDTYICFHGKFNWTVKWIWWADDGPGYERVVLNLSHLFLCTYFSSSSSFIYCLFSFLVMVLSFFLLLLSFFQTFVQRWIFELSYCVCFCVEMHASFSLNFCSECVWVRMRVRVFVYYIHTLIVWDLFWASYRMNNTCSHLLFALVCL